MIKNLTKTIMLLGALTSFQAYADIPPNFKGFACVSNGNVIISKGGELESIYGLGKKFKLYDTVKKDASSHEGMIIEVQGEVREEKDGLYFAPVSNNIALSVKGKCK